MHSNNKPFPAALWIAPSTPPPPSKDVLALSNFPYITILDHKSSQYADSGIYEKTSIFSTPNFFRYSTEKLILSSVL